MPKYEVTLKEIEIYTLEVEAKSLDDAIEKAWNEIQEYDGKDKYHNMSDGSATATEIG